MKKREPRDINELAFSIVDDLTGDAPPEPPKNPAAVARGRKGGVKGGKARAAKLTSAQRSEIAQRAAQKRWER